MRIISRHTYEEWFIDYIDGNLNESEQSQLSAFLARNPDLQQEFELFLEIPALQPLVEEHSTDLSFQKNIITTGPVNADNYTEYFVARLEGDLSTKDKAKLSEFLDANPALANEYSLIQSIRLKPDNSIVYPNKDELTRIGKKIRLGWIYYSSAAAILLLIGWFGYLQISNGPSIQYGMELKKIPGRRTNLTQEKFSPPSTQPGTLEKNPVPEVKKAPVRRKPLQTIELENAGFALLEMETEDYLMVHSSKIETNSPASLPGMINHPPITKVEEKEEPSWIKKALKEEWVFRIDRTDEGKFQRIRISSPLVNFNP